MTSRRGGASACRRRDASRSSSGWTSEGLARALALRCQSAANVDEILVEGDELTYRIVDCRVQNARKRKGMGFHPCRSVGVVEYGVFAESIDDRISCECLSCFPDMTDDSCNCAWKFTLKA